MSSGGPYDVLYSGAMLERIDRLMSRAVEAGIAQRFASTLRHVEGMLTLDPVNWGERIYSSRLVGLDVYHRIHDGIYLVFAIHAQDRRVWLTRVYPIIGHPLHDPNESLN